MAATVIGYMLGNASLLQPVLQRGLGEAVIEADKDLVSRLAVLIFIIEPYQFQSLAADRIVHQFLGLLHTKRDVHATVTVGLNLVPCQLLDVAFAQACQTREEESLFQDLRRTWCIGEIDKLLTRKMLLLRGDSVDTLQESVGILHNLVLSVGGMEYGAEG